MLKVKDIIALGALAAVSFPVVLLGVLLWTGNVRMVFGPEAQDPTARARLLERPEDIPGATKGSSDSSQATISDSSLLLRQADLDRREAEALRETQRVLMIQQDDSRLQDTITAERKRLEALLSKGDTLDGSRTAVLASTFANMKADQAAKILLALDDVLAVAILRHVPDDKPRAKILANMGKIDVRRAAQISRLLAAVPGPGKSSTPAQAEAPNPKESVVDSTKTPKAGATPGDSPVSQPKTEKKIMIPSVFPMLVGPATSSNAGTSQAPGTTAFGPMKGFDPSIGATSASMPSSNSNFGQTPSTEGFLHVLDMLLTSSPMPQAGSTSVSNLLVQTSVTTTMGDLSKASTKEIQDPAATPLDPSLSAGIAALLQGLGFQVRPEQISQLSPMDRQQLESALEFASRNLQKGTDTTQVAEFTALLLPRPWPLDDRNGTPASTATAVQGQDVLPLPAGFIQSLDKIRAQLHTADLASATATVDSPLQTAPNARWPDVAIAKPDQAHAVPTTSSSALAAALNTTPAPTSKVDSPPKSQDLSNPVPGSGVAKASATALASAVAATSAVSSGPGRASNPDSDPALQVLQGLQTSASAKDQGTNGLVATDIQTRHLPPGGTASEFIGRQVLEKVQVQLSEGRRELSLRLWPDELGEVRLSLRMTEDEKVHAHMVVENNSVRQAMLDSMPQLRDALTRHGMDLEKMTVSVEQKDAGSAGQGSDDPGEFRERAGKGARSGGFRDEEMSVAVPLTMGQDTGRRNGFNTIDLWS